MAPKKSDILVSFPVSTGTYAEMLNEIIARSYTGVSSSVCIANVHMIVTAHRDRQFAPVIKRADIVTPDGLPLTWAMRLLLGIKQQRVAGMDLLPDLISVAESSKIPVYFYGGTNDILETTRHYLAENYGMLNIAGMYSPPFRTLTNEEEDE